MNKAREKYDEERREGIQKKKKKEVETQNKAVERKKLERKRLRERPKKSETN